MDLLLSKTQPKFSLQYLQGFLETFLQKKSPTID